MADLPCCPEGYRLKHRVDALAADYLMVATTEASRLERRLAEAVDPEHKTGLNAELAVVREHQQCALAALRAHRNKLDVYPLSEEEALKLPDLLLRWVNPPRAAFMISGESKTDEPRPV